MYLNYLQDFLKLFNLYRRHIGKAAVFAYTRLWEPLNKILGIIYLIDIIYTEIRTIHRWKNRLMSVKSTSISFNHCGK